MNKINRVRKTVSEVMMVRLSVSLIARLMISLLGAVGIRRLSSRIRSNTITVSFIEKPITDNPRTAADIVRRAKARGVICEVGHIERFSPTFRAREDYDVTKLYVEAEALQARGLSAADLVVPVEVVSAQRMAEIMEGQDVILSF